MKLDDVYRECLDEPEDAFYRHKRILWVGSESYDAPAIGVLQGLDILGFEVYTVGKPNVNSWFCNRVTDDPSGLAFDFVLSSLHWGTRWSHYDRHGLHGYPKVLIDGDDARSSDHTWRDKYDVWVGFYELEGSDEIKDAEISDHRWMEPLGGYEPDVVFTWQKQRGDGTIYLPGSIHDQFRAMGGDRVTQDRPIDFAHFPGPGVWRVAMEDLLAVGALPGRVHNGASRGEPVYPEAVRGLAGRDGDNVHSYHRWACWTDYYRALNDSKVVVHPGIDHFPFWECNRIYEAWACGCLVAMREPCTDVSGYPPTEVCPEAVYRSHEELMDKARFWHDHPDHLDSRRRKGAERAARFFAPEAVARYFLHRIRGTL